MFYTVYSFYTKVFKPYMKYFFILFMDTNMYVVGLKGYTTNMKMVV